MEHPGTITFVDESAGTEEVESIEGIPQEIAFVRIADERVPVTRIVSQMRGTRRVIRSYAEDGRLLASTVQAPPPDFS